MWGATITGVLFSKPIVLFVVSIIAFILLRFITRDEKEQQKKEDTANDDCKLDFGAEEDTIENSDCSVDEKQTSKLDIGVYLEIGVASVLSSILVNALM